MYMAESMFTVDIGNTIAIFAVKFNILKRRNTIFF